MLENVTYSPLIYSRVAEIKALYFLPPILKNQIFPVVRARPWPNAKHLVRTWDKIDEAFDGRRFGLDLDDGRRGHPNRNPAGAEFDALFEPQNGFQNYYNEIDNIPFAIPVLRSSPASSDLDLQNELANVENLNRGLVVRISQETGGDYLAHIRRVYASVRDFVLIVDAGWSTELLLQQAWAQAILDVVAQISSIEDAEHIEAIMCGSSFPDSFSSIGSRGEFQSMERVLFDDLVRGNNRIDLTYGDWASGRPPMEPTPMTPVPRIDNAFSREWVSFRKVEEEEYADIARRVIADRTWEDLGIWGTRTIQSTADSLPGMIRSPQTNVAVRMNIHMYRQASYGAAEFVGDQDEPFVDD